MNAKTLSCKDFGMDCPFSVTSEDGQEAMDIATAHLKNKHGDKLASMTEEERNANMEKMKSMVA
ncbi:DUF1059 domain-containing protein [Candidatus Daviesbacteria bacterium]|nr:DUF1059 domain-containing protein [Candidatus Daviesbacteria bacterium]